MAAASTFPNLGAVACSQLTFGADVRLTPSQVGAIRDSVLALFPAQSLPPWYFRELYQWGDVTYEVAASVSASNRTDRTKPYSLFFRITRLEEQGFEAPLISELIEILDPQEELEIYCSTTFVRSKDEGSPRLPLPFELHQEDSERHLLESYTLGIYESSEVRVGTAEVRPIGSESYYYNISFSRKGIIGAHFSNILLDQAVGLLSRVHHESAGGAHAANSA